MPGYVSEPTGLQALVVDDDSNMRLLARATLESIGFEVLEARDGEAAEEMLAECQPDVVLLDVLMPGIDGFEVCQNLRLRADFENLPVIMMTSLEDLDSVNRAYEVGATDFVGKPVNWEILKHRVRYSIRASIAFRGLANAQRIARLGNWDWSPESGEVVCSDEVNRNLGLPREVQPRSYDEFSASIHPEDRERVHAIRQAAIEMMTPYDVGYRVAGSSVDRHVHEHGEVLSATRASGLRVTGTVQDITERRIFEERIQHMALHDALTGLPNRRLFQERLNTALESALRKDEYLALLYFDLDKFKRVNDTFGHDSGDAVLQEAASRVTECIRKIDAISVGPAATDRTLARFGGDEFIVLLSNISSPADAARVARRILQRLEQPFDVGGVSVHLTSSIGITVGPDDGANGETLLKNADVAMYHAKEQGRNNYQFFTGELNDRVQRRMTMETELGKAIENDELRLVYQPIFDVGDGKLLGAEALIRWESAELGFVRPDQFIHVAEEVGLIVPIGEWVLRAACAQCHEWLARLDGPFRIAVNVSAVQLRELGFADALIAILDEHELQPEHLQLELTESVLMEDIEVSDRLLPALREMGVTVAVDDFGTGYSSLSYLRRFHPDSLKIDRAFVHDLGADEDADAIISTILAMAQSLKIRVVAEGVENRSQLDLLRGLGCDAVQGFLLGRPGPAEAISEILEAQATTGYRPDWLRAA